LLKIDARGKRVLFISDTHIPYSVKGYLKFLSDLKNEFKPDIVIHGGDEVDGHAISFHKSHCELYSAGQELDRSIIEIQEGLHKLFPKMYLLESNHGSLIYRRLKFEGIPIRHLKPLHELYETPLWSWHEKILIETDMGKVLVAHGFSGVAMAWAKLTGTSTVEFHYHSKFHISYFMSCLGLRFSMHCSCLADRESLAMAYAKTNMAEFINGTGMLMEDGEPQLKLYRKEKYEDGPTQNN
jgi:hypothetical protein